MTATTVAAPIARRGSRRVRRERVLGLSLTLPTVLLMLALTAVPVIEVVYGAFSEDGRRAYSRLVRTPGFPQMLRNTMEWVVICVVGAVLLGFLAALVLSQKRLRWPGLWRSILLLPWITPAVVTATVWKWLYSRDYGMINGVLQRVGIIDEPVSWLTNSTVVLPALAMVQVWASFPFVMMLISAALQAVPEEVREAAQLDGANAVQVFFRVILPALRDIAFIVVLIVVVWSFNSFVPVWVITQGGPAGASNILAVQLYQQFQNGTSASVSVIALIQLVISMLFASVYVRQTRRADS